MVIVGKTVKKFQVIGNRDKIRWRPKREKTYE